MAAARSRALRLDMMSQPCRAVVIGCWTLNIPFHSIPVVIHKGGTRTAVHKQINPMMQVPSLEEWDAPSLPAGTAVGLESIVGAIPVPNRNADFVLMESTSILRYLCTTHPATPDHWYPAVHPSGGSGMLHAARKRAAVDSKLDWYHASLRPGARDWAFKTVLAPQVGAPVDLPGAEAGRKQLMRCLRVMEGWLAQHPYLAGEAISIADLPAACEISQLDVLPPTVWSPQHLADGYPHVSKWYGRVQADTKPHWNEAHTILNRTVAYFRSKDAAAVANAPSTEGRGAGMV